MRGMLSRSAASALDKCNSPKSTFPVTRTYQDLGEHRGSIAYSNVPKARH
jgi:hypothetical protein